MAPGDNFEIDPYGDAAGGHQPQDQHDKSVEAGGSQMRLRREGNLRTVTTHQSVSSANDTAQKPVKKENHDASTIVAPVIANDPIQKPIKSEEDNASVIVDQMIASTDPSAAKDAHLPNQPAQKQSTGREQGEIDQMYVDPAATAAIIVSQLHWYTTEEDVRGWANQSRQVYVLFKSLQATTAMKEKVESFGEGQQVHKKLLVSYANPTNNPFQLLPRPDYIHKIATPNNNERHPLFSQGKAETSHHEQQGGGFGGNKSASPLRGGFPQPAGGFNNPGRTRPSPMGGIPSSRGVPPPGGIPGFMNFGGMGMPGANGGPTGMPIMNIAMGGMGMGGMGIATPIPQMRGGMGMQGNRPFGNSRGGWSSFAFPQQQQPPSRGAGENTRGTKRPRHD
ncbi:MAG: hypothetical protein Q9163_002154 [Psora crenata]